jgi:hypothetical protein
MRLSSPAFAPATRDHSERTVVKRWLTVAVDSGVAWPMADTRISFRGREFQLQAETDQFAACVVLEYDDSAATMTEAVTFVEEFLSSVSWIERGSIRTGGMNSGSRLMRIGRGPKGRIVTRKFYGDHLPVSDDPKVRLALALHREGLNLVSASVPYAFLSFAKIINILHGTGSTQIAWINAAVPQLSFSYEAQERAQRLRQEGKDVGEYLYGSGRCAVAHAYSDAINPENPEDIYRLSLDLPLIKALSEYLIEHEFGVQSWQTIALAHKYELDGFRALFGEPLLERILSGERVEPAALPALPAISLRVRDHEGLVTFTRMRATTPAIEHSQVALPLESADGRLRTVVNLNFESERMEFDPEKSVRVASDDASVEVIEASLDQLHMLWWLALNGQLEIWDEDANVLMGRSDPYVPMNVNVGLTIENLTKARDALLAEIARRKRRPAA